MKAIAEETLLHPTLGNLIKKFVYTFDESIYPTVQDAITARNAFNLELGIRQAAFNQALIDLQNSVITPAQFLVIKNNFISWQETTPKGWMNKEPFLPPTEDNEIDFRQLAILNAQILNRTL